MLRLPISRVDLLTAIAFPLDVDTAIPEPLPVALTHV
jgi:hypothetical protein